MEDNIQRIKAEEDVSWITIAFSIISIFAYIGDFGGDIVTSILLFKSGQYIWGGLTLGFTLIPMLIVNFCTGLWFCRATAKRNLNSKLHVPEIRESNFNFAVIFQIITHVLLCGVISRHAQIFYHGIRHKKEKKKLPSVLPSRKCDKYLKLFAQERKEVAQLQLFECFLQDVPQFTLQIYIWAKRNQGKIVPLECNLLCLTQLVSITFCLISFTFAIVNFQQCVHTLKSGESKLKISIVTTLVQSVWRLGTTGARVFAIVLGILSYPYVTILILTFHWALMSLWFKFWRVNHLRKASETGNSITSRGYDCLMGCVYIFCYLNLTENHSAMPLSKFYTLTTLEDIFLLTLWYFRNYTDVNDLKQFWGFTAIVFIYCNAFVVGIGAMIIYYRILRNSVNLGLSRRDENLAEIECIPEMCSNPEENIK